MTFTGALTIAGDASNKILLDIAALDGYTLSGGLPTNQLGDPGGIQRPAKNEQHKDGYEFRYYMQMEESLASMQTAEIEYTHFINNGMTRFSHLEPWS